MESFSSFTPSFTQKVAANPQLFTSVLLRFFLPFLLFSLLHTSLEAKGHSLFQIWKDPSQSDSMRIVALSDYIAKKFVVKEPDSTQIYTDELKAFSEKKRQKFGTANAKRLLGAAKFFDYKDVEAINLLNESLELYEELNYKLGEAKALHVLGMVYKRQSKEVKSMGYYEKSLLLYEQLGDLDDYAGALMDVGSIHKIAENYDKALAHFQKAYKSFQKLGKEIKEAGALAQIASIYRRKKEFEKALEINREAMAIREKQGELSSVASSLNNIGNVYEDMNDFELALEYHFRALDIREKLGAKGKVASSLRNIGETYHDLNKSKKAVYYCKKSLDIYEEINVISRQLSCSQCLYEAHKKLGNSAETLKYLENMFELRAKVGHEKSVQQLQRMEFDKQIMADSMARVEEKMEIALLHQKAIEAKEKTRNRAISAFVLSLLLAIGFYLRWRFLRKANAEIKREYDRAESLLLNILPAEIAEELKETGEAMARNFNQVSVLFTDFKGFTQISEKLSAKELVEELNACFKAFDEIITKHGLEKIKTIGDAYMAAGGLPAPDEEATKKTVMAAFEMSAFIINRQKALAAEGKLSFEMRIGIHTGPVVAGIVGVKKFQYDIWGDTVNTASRMESSGVVGKVNVSEYVYDILKEDKDFVFEERGKIEVKGKGEVTMYFIEKSSSKSSLVLRQQETGNI